MNMQFGNNVILLRTFFFLRRLLFGCSRSNFDSDTSFILDLCSPWQSVQWREIIYSVCVAAIFRSSMSMLDIYIQHIVQSFRRMQFGFNVFFSFLTDDAPGPVVNGGNILAAQHNKEERKREGRSHIELFFITFCCFSVFFFHFIHIFIFRR